MIIILKNNLQIGKDIIAQLIIKQPILFLFLMNFFIFWNACKYFIFFKFLQKKIEKEFWMFLQ